MGKRGPAPKPTALRLVEGDRDVVAHRKVNKREPKLTRFRTPPKPPADLDARTKKHWRSLAKILTDMQVLTAADIPALRKLAFEVGLLEQIRQDLDQAGYFYQTTKTKVYHLTPPWRAMLALAPSVDRGFKCFGLEPSARTGLRTEGPKTAGDPTDDWSDF